MELSKENTIRAIRIGADADWVVERLKNGEARFGWGYHDKEDARNGEASKAYLLLIEKGDVLVYINIPSYGNVTAVKVSGGYSYKSFKEGSGVESRHCIEVEKDSIFSFNRNDKEVGDSLRTRLGLQGRQYRITAREEFENVLQAYKDGKLDKVEASPESRLADFIKNGAEELNKLCNILSKSHNRKKLEHPLVQCLINAMPTATVDDSRDSHGLDAIIYYKEIPFGDMEEKRCAVQIKSFTGDVSDDKPIRDIEEAFERKENGEEFSSGLIMMTGKPTYEFYEKLAELKAKYPEKPIGLLAGNELILFVMRYYPDLLRVAQSLSS